MEEGEEKVKNALYIFGGVLFLDVRWMTFQLRLLVHTMAMRSGIEGYGAYDLWFVQYSSEGKE